MPSLVPLSVRNASVNKPALSIVKPLHEIMSKEQVIEHLQKGLSPEEISIKFNIQQEDVLAIAEERECFELLSNPRRILARQLRKMIFACDSAVQQYLDNTMDTDYAHAISPLMSELRGIITDLQNLQDPQVTANAVLDRVIQPVIRGVFKDVSESLWSVLTEAGTKLEPKVVNSLRDNFKTVIKDMGKQSTILYRSAITNLETVLEVSLDDRRQELIAPLHVHNVDEDSSSIQTQSEVG